jgi:hypothetical protein
MRFSGAAPRCVARLARGVGWVVLVVSFSAPGGRAAGRAEPPEVPVEQRGLSIGVEIPAFQAPDQWNRPRDFASLAGPRGLVLLFVRSADW